MATWKEKKEERKQRNIQREAERRRDEGDSSKYVREYFGEKFGPPQEYRPTVDDEATGRGKGIQTSIVENWTKKKQEKKDRREYAAGIMDRAGSGGVNSIAREDFIDQRHLFPESFQDSNVYANYMQDLHEINPPAMQQAFPWASGKGLADLVTMATPLKYLGGAMDWGQEKLGQGVDWASQGLGDIYENIKESDLVEDLSGLKNLPGAIHQMVSPVGHELLNVVPEPIRNIGDQIQELDAWEDLKGLKNMPGEFLNLLPGISGHAQGGIVETMPDNFHDYSRGI